MINDLLLSINLEISSGHGEDTYLTLDFDDGYVIGVFDGLGGRSAGFDGITGGQIASKEASQTSEQILRQYNGKLTTVIAHQIQDTICQNLKSQADTKMQKSRLSGTLTGKRLCTTIAITAIHEQETGSYSIDLAWMGDSRIYFLSPSKGLQQLTKDDLKVSKNAFEVIRSDPPMSQYLTADISPEWRINYTQKSIRESGFILACTDGCFQYLPAPWCFERLIIETMMKAESLDKWKFFLEEEYTQIKQDDVSLVLYPLGFNNFEDIKKSYIDRCKELLLLEENTTNETEALREIWNTHYQKNYELRLQEEILNEDQIIEDVNNESSIKIDTLSSADTEYKSITKNNEEIIPNKKNIEQTSDGSFVNPDISLNKKLEDNLNHENNSDNISNHQSLVTKKTRVHPELPDLPPRPIFGHHLSVEPPTHEK